eukprot:TRINITY_DN458_c0_g6_i1.p1 TRINITY_DN458_c0_g6~~TRINITY_DN458_c0_g6_i1.p1  ORF type:complete len:1920 (-),score=455.95 TRINITY_DN458_c0_g6_i1:187-5574(-)
MAVEGALSSKIVDFTDLGRKLEVKRHRDDQDQGHVGIVVMKPCARLWIPERPYAQATRHVTEVIIGASFEATLHNPGVLSSDSRSGVKSSAVTLRSRRLELRYVAHGPDLKVPDGLDMSQLTEHLASSWFPQAHTRPERWKVLFVKASGGGLGAASSSVPASLGDAATGRASSGEAAGAAGAAGDEEAHWICAVCTLENPASAAECDVCQAPRPGGAGSQRNGVGEGDEETWVCPVCTFENAIDMPICEVCETVREETGSPAAGAGEAQDADAAPVAVVHGPLVDPLLGHLPKRDKKKAAPKGKLQCAIESGKFNKPLLDQLGKSHGVPNGVFSLFERLRLLDKIDLQSQEERHQVVWALKECAAAFQDEHVEPVFAWLASLVASLEALRLEVAQEGGDREEAKKRPHVPIAWLAKDVLKRWPSVTADDQKFLEDAASRLMRGRPWTQPLTLKELRGFFEPVRGRYLVVDAAVRNKDIKLAMLFLRRSSPEVLRARWETPDLTDRTMPKASFFHLYDTLATHGDHEAAEELVDLIASAYTQGEPDPLDALRAFFDRAPCPRQRKRDFLVAFVSACRRKGGMRQPPVASAAAAPAEAAAKRSSLLGSKKAAPKAAAATTSASNAPVPLLQGLDKCLLDVFLAMLSLRGSTRCDFDGNDVRETLETLLLLAPGDAFNAAWAKGLTESRADSLRNILEEMGAAHIADVLRNVAGLVIVDQDAGKRLLAGKEQWTHDNFGSRYFSERSTGLSTYQTVCQLIGSYVKLDLALGGTTLYQFIQQLERGAHFAAAGLRTNRSCTADCLNKLAPRDSSLRIMICEEVSRSLIPSFPAASLQDLIGYLEFFDFVMLSFFQSDDAVKAAQASLQQADFAIILQAVVKTLSLDGSTSEQSPGEVIQAVTDMCRNNPIACQFVVDLCRKIVARPHKDFLQSNSKNGFNAGNLQECARRLQVASEVIDYKVQAGRVNKAKLLENVHGVINSFQQSPPYLWESYFGSLDTIIFFIEYMGKEDLGLTYKQLDQDLEGAITETSTEKEKKNNQNMKDLLACAKKMYTQPLVHIDASNLASMQSLDISKYINEHATRLKDKISWCGITFTPKDWDDILDIAGTTARAMQEKFNVLMLPHHTQMITLIMLAIRACGATLKGEALPQTTLARVGTGEGKSWIIGMLAAFIAKRGARTKGGLRAHVVIDNVTLKSRDYDTVSMFFQKLNIKASESEEHLRNPEYQVVYCTGAEIWSQCRQTQEAGEEDAFETSVRNTVLIVDEVDGLIIDGDANVQYMYVDDNLSASVDAWCRQLENDITPDVIPDKNADPVAISEQRYCLSKVLEAYDEAKAAERGKEFEWRGGEMYMMDKTTGMLAVGFWDLWYEIRHWIETEWAGWVTYKCIKGILCKKHCFTSYPCIFGLTGSLGQKAEKSYLAEQYDAVSFNVPYFLDTCKSDEKAPADQAKGGKPQLKKLNAGDVVQPDEATQLRKVVEMATKRCAEVPVLIIAKDQQSVELVARRLEGALPNCQRGPRKKDEDTTQAGKDRVIRLLEQPGHPKRFVKLVDLATQPWDVGDSKGKGKTFRITVTTAEGGRGHDYRVVDPAIDAKGGMLLILMWVSWSEREWIQFLGRTARQDHEGQIAVFLNEQSDDMIELENDRQLAGNEEELPRDHSIVDLMLAAGDRKMQKKFAKIGDEIERGTLMHRLTAQYWNRVKMEGSTSEMQENVWRKLCREYLQSKVSVESIKNDFEKYFPLVDCVPVTVVATNTVLALGECDDDHNAEAIDKNITLGESDEEAHGDRGCNLQVNACRCQ